MESSLTTEMQGTISIVRSIIGSRKEAANLKEILRDYRELEGNELPKYHYKTVEDLLKSSNEFNVKKSNDELFISVKLNDNSQHINKFVREQKSNRMKRNDDQSTGDGQTNNGSTLRAPRRLHKSGNNKTSNVSTTTSTQSSTSTPTPTPQTTSGYSKMYSQKPARSPRKFISSSSNTSNNNNNNNNNNTNGNQNNNNNKTSNEIPRTVRFREDSIIQRSINKNNNDCNNKQQNNSTNNKQQKKSDYFKRTNSNDQQQLLINKTNGNHHYQRSISDEQRNMKNNNNSNNRDQFKSASLLVRQHSIEKKSVSKVEQSTSSSPSSPATPPINTIQYTQQKQLAQVNLQLPLKQHPQLPQIVQYEQKPSNLQQRLIQKQHPQPMINNNKDNNINDQETIAIKYESVIESKSPLNNRLLRLQYNLGNDGSNNGGVGINDHSGTILTSPTTTTPPPPPQKQYDNLMTDSVNDGSIQQLSSPAFNRIGHNIVYYPNNNNNYNNNKNGYRNFNNTNVFRNTIASINVDQLNKINPVKALDMYCEIKKYGTPEYKFFKLKKTERIQCRIQILNTNYSTYPIDFSSEHQAQYETAKVALNTLLTNDTIEEYPICMDSDFDLSVKLFNLLKNYQHGVFKTKIPELFQENYKETLPIDVWYKLITGAPQMFSIEDSVQDDYIIYANIRKQSSSIASNSSSSSDVQFIDVNNNNNQNNITSNNSIATAMNNSNYYNNSNQIAQQHRNHHHHQNVKHSKAYEIDKLILPWSEKHWNLFITNPVSTTEIWGRLIGPEYSDKMDMLTTDIELVLLNNKRIPREIKKNYIYLVCVSECWYRVRCERIDHQQKRCYCFFIDVGEVDWFSMTDIFMCDLRFQKFPAQALCFSLFGLEDFAEMPYAKRHLDENLAAKVLIGEILTKPEEYQAQDESTDYDAKIQVVLFDTASDEDVYVNPLILERICTDTPVPKLKRSQLIPATIAYVNDYGDLYLQIDDSGLHYIRKIIHNLITSDFDMDQYRIKSLKDIQIDTTNAALDTNNKKNLLHLYLIMDKIDMKWYRAIAKSKSNIKSQCEMFYVDFGMTRSVQERYIYRLDAISAALYRYPSQAIQVKLYNVAAMNESNIATLRGQFSIDTKVIVKQMGQTSGNNIPFINIYKRLPKDNLLVSINESIRIEQEASELSTKFDKLTTDGNAIISKNDAIQMNTKFAFGDDKMLSIKIDNPILPKINEFFNVSITMASNPTYFKVRSHQQGPILHEMMLKLQEYCKSIDESSALQSKILIGEAYAGLHTDGNWYRVIVENIYDDILIHICFCDYGDIAIVGPDQLKPLPKHFRTTLPKQAISAKLYGIQPINKDWHFEDCIYFQQLTVNKQFASIVKNITVDVLHGIDEGPTIELILFDVSTNEDINLNDIFVNENRANKM